MAEQEHILQTNGMYLATEGNAKGVDFTDSHFCYACAQAFKEPDMVKFRGAWYGKSCGCSTDIDRILLGEAERRRTHTERSDRD